MPSIIDNIDALRTRQRAYHTAFRSDIGAEVLRDLAKFCRANESCFHKDARLHAVLEGRREVWLRIAQHLNLTTEQLFALFQGQAIQLKEDTTPNE